ncbi:MAG: S41 family peptidase [Planctomycetota bacterium]
MKLTTPRRQRLFLTSCAAAMIAMPALGQVATVSNAEVASDLWSSALDGRLERIEQFIERQPDADANELQTRVDSTLMQLRGNRERANTERLEARAEAHDELVTHIEGDELLLALESAIRVQSRSVTFDEVFEDAEVDRVISMARAELPGVLRQNDWLYARELLFYLRTLYDDTDRYEEYDYYNTELDRINKRVTLIAQYAPRRLHELRARRAERLGEEAIGEFNEASAQDWTERIDGVSERILRSSLGKAADHHVEQYGWRPLLEGGLEAMRVLATTRALDETFPELADASSVSQWLEAVDNLDKSLAGIDDADLSGRIFSALLDQLLLKNENTLQLPPKVLYREFGDGAIYNLDRYTEVIWPNELRRFNQATVGNFVGVGILIRHNEARDIMVVNPLEGAPAYYSGVKPDDLIVSVNGESTVGWSLNDAVDRITGRPGSKVNLGIKRDGIDGVLEIAIKRQVIKIRSVKGWWKEGLDASGSPEWNWFIDPDTRIAYIRLTQFTDDTYDDLRAAVAEISKHGNPNGLILDLRFNPGGLLTSAIDVSNLFVKRGVIVSGEDKDGNKAWPDHRARPGLAELHGLPTVVLINRGSASASEIVSGCLQAHSAAVVVGDRSFGKGSVQTVHPVTMDAKLKLTTHYYRLPSSDDGRTPGRFVHRRDHAHLEDEWGVIPDIEVKMSDDQVRMALELRQESDLIPENDQGELDPNSDERPDVSDLLTDGLDPQLETALLILQAQALANFGSDDERVTMRQSER